MQDKTRRICLATAIAVALSLASLPVLVQGRAPAPEVGSGWEEKVLVHARRVMMATAHPLASQAGYEILQQGGSAMDAALAAQLVLSLVEPQSSGLGGGAFIVHYDHNSDRIQSYDGRETAPAGVTSDVLTARGQALDYGVAVNSGFSVGVPGLLRLLELAHRHHGKLPWPVLFEPAIQRAQNGFAVTRRLHVSIAHNRPELAAQPAAAGYFLDQQGQPWPVGHILRNPVLAQTLRLLAERGAEAFYEGTIAQDIVAAVRSHARPGVMSMDDLLRYRALEREPVCSNYRVFRICGMAPPGSGVTVQQMLGILEHFPMSEFAPLGVDAVHYFAEAGRLAYADRDRYLADPAFVNVPVQAMLSHDYLSARAALIQPERSLGVAQAGEPVPRSAAFGQGEEEPQPSTSHLVAVDAQGNIVSMTTTIEAAFGSKIFVRGFLLNNELTDFSWVSRDALGHWAANRVEPGKRPRSAMSPTIVLRDGKPIAALGAPGGTAIVNFVARTLVGVLDWGLDIQQAITLPHFGSRNGCTELEKDTALQALVGVLQDRGHDVCESEFPSGLQGIVITPDGLQGGADPRREGVAIGE